MAYGIQYNDMPI